MEESLTATLLETDVALTLKYFLHRMNALVAALTKSTFTPDEVAFLKYQLLTDFDSYSAVDSSHKDTTRDRIERYKAALNISVLYRSLLDRFEVVAVRFQAVHSLRTLRLQTLLTLVFGFFGALSCLFTILSKVGEKRAWELHVVVLLSICCASIAALILYCVIRFTIRNRIK